MGREQWGAEMAKVTIEDISRHTGLSRGTVSRALNDRPDISRQTKQRVLEACRKLNYAPSHAARSLATGRSLGVAVLVDDLQSVFAASFLRGVLGRARAVGYAVHVAELGPDSDQRSEAIRALRRERVDTFLVGAPLPGDLLGALREAVEERPLVACAAIDGLVCDVLSPDHREAGRLAARHLLGEVGGPLLYVHAPRQGGAERLAGFQDVCREHGLAARELTVELPDEPPIHPHTEKVLGERLAGVRAVACGNDFLAIELMFLCYRLGRIPGRDIAILGQGNEPAGARIRPSLSTVDYCGEEIGRRATDTALQRLGRARLDAPQTVLVPPVLVARETTRLKG